MAQFIGLCQYPPFFFLWHLQTLYCQHPSPPPPPPTHTHTHTRYILTTPTYTTQPHTGRFYWVCRCSKETEGQVQQRAGSCGVCVAPCYHHGNRSRCHWSGGTGSLHAETSILVNFRKCCVGGKGCVCCVGCWWRRGMAALVMLWPCFQCLLKLGFQIFVFI